MRVRLASCLIAVVCLLAWPRALRAQESAAASAPVEGGTSVAPAPKDDVLDRWWIGGDYRHLWVPGYMTDPFFASAPAISNDGFGLVATYRTLGSLSIEMGVGYMPYSFHGPFLADGKPIEDTELVRSDLKFWHLTSSLLWAIEFHRTVALEIGVGLDLGLFSGDVDPQLGVPRWQDRPLRGLQRAADAGDARPERHAVLRRAQERRRERQTRQQRRALQPARESLADGDGVPDAAARGAAPAAVQAPDDQGRVRLRHRADVRRRVAARQLRAAQGRAEGSVREGTRAAARERTRDSAR